MDERCIECIAYCNEGHISTPCNNGEQCDVYDELYRDNVKDSTELSGGHLW